MSNVEAIGRLFAVSGPTFNLNLPSFDGIYPNRDAPVVRNASGGGRELVVMRWGLPSSQATARPITNLRNLSRWRTLLSQPDRRVLVVVTAFAEYEGEVGAKRKVWFGRADGEPFAFVGVWRPSPDGDRMAFLTCEPNDTVAAVHPKAMPVVLPAASYDSWLSDSYTTVCALALPHLEGSLTRLRD